MAVNVARPSLIAGALALLALAARPAPAQEPRMVRPPVIRAAELTEEQFRRQLSRLPDSTVLEIAGRRLTLGEFKAEQARRQKEAAAKAEAARRQASAEAEARRLDLERRWQAQLEAGNARALAEFRRLTAAPRAADAAQREAIREEASRLLARSRRAAPAERAEIERRAAELLAQLERLEAARAIPPR